MKIIHTISDIRQQIAAYKQAGQSIGFVPTMGNLHQGHLRLVEMAASTADCVVCSIFVNPMQFGKGEDFNQYPRTLTTDTQKLQKTGCDVVFAPAINEMYPDLTNNDQDNAGNYQSQIIVPGICDVLEGASRPGHFTGVATVVAKLFNMVQPDQAIFGEKDYQQLQVVTRMVKELCFPIEIISHPIVREKNGLAMSSRNAYLSDSQKQQAAGLYRILQSLSTRIHEGGRDYDRFEQDAAQELNHLGFTTDYVKIRASNLNVPTQEDKELVILTAAVLGNTRLIDNIQLCL